jgi:hypothetical protein
MILVYNISVAAQIFHFFTYMFLILHSCLYAHYRNVKSEFHLHVHNVSGIGNTPMSRCSETQLMPLILNIQIMFFWVMTLCNHCFVYTMHFGELLTRKYQQ